MDNFPSQTRRSLKASEARDDLGSVPDGYSVAPDPVDDRWQGSVNMPASAQDAVVVQGESRKQSASKSAGRALREILETVFLAALIFFGVRLLVLNFKVEGQSMMPNLINTELLLVNRNAYGDIDLNRWLNRIPGVDRDGSWVVWEFSPPKRGDIIVFDPPNGDDKPYIKRVIATEGETVQVKDGNVYVNDIQLDEPYIREGITECLTAECKPIVVPKDSVFVLGDNRRASSDSRAFGTVPVENIIGKAIVTYWPMSEIGLVPHYDYPEINE